MQRQAPEDELGLSAEALAALQEFAVDHNLGIGEDVEDLRLQVQECMDVKDRYHDFTFTFGEGGDDNQISISLRGVNPELGQTLASTGLTVWRAAEEMARFLWEYRRWLVGKSVVELGAGLGLCGVLASHLCRRGKVVVTDGGEEFTDSAMEALRENLEKNTFQLSAGMSTTQDRAQVCLERLTWGDHGAFVNSHQSGFDFIVAADVLYADEAVSPLLRTVADLLNLRRTQGSRGISHTIDHENERSSMPEGCDAKEVGISTTGTGADVSESRTSTGAEEAGLCEAPPSNSCFLLAFAKRHVSIDRVLTEAEGLGLKWKIPKDFTPTSTSENIYLMWLP